MKAAVYEIFPSIQGEGFYCGQKQVFLRFAGCNLSCRYCDEPAARKTAGGVELSAKAAAAKVLKLAGQSSAAAVSLTGGEPLLNAGFIKALIPALKKAGLKTHLETNGTLCRELGAVAGGCDAIAMDIKLPSSCGGRAFWTEHARSLAVAPEKTFVKVVVTSRTSTAEFAKALELVRAAGPDMPFFIQPATPQKGVKAPSRTRIDVLYGMAAKKLAYVRVLPQMHKLWGIK